MTTTANSILAQMGGNKFTAMTGAQCVTTPDALHVHLPRAARGVNSIVIRLDPTDTYTVLFNKRRGLNLKQIAAHSGVYADQLQTLFTTETGLATHL